MYPEIHELIPPTAAEGSRAKPAEIGCRFDGRSEVMENG